MNLESPQPRSQTSFVHLLTNQQSHHLSRHATIILIRNQPSPLYKPVTATINLLEPATITPSQPPYVPQPTAPTFTSNQDHHLKPSRTPPVTATASAKPRPQQTSHHPLRRDNKQLSTYRPAIASIRRAVSPVTARSRSSPPRNHQAAVHERQYNRNFFNFRKLW